MNSIRISLLALVATATVRAQTHPATHPTAADRESFTLTATPPPVPARKYQLLYHDLSDRRPGNAAGLYFDAMLLLGNDGDELFMKAEDALDDNHDLQTFTTLADRAIRPDLYQELDLAARCETCDFGAPIREQGVRSLLPHLNAARQLARTLRVRALRQLQQDRPVDAIATLRDGYELADKIATEPALVSSLVSVGITAYLDATLAQVMSHPDCPNLYWALAEFPPRKTSFRYDADRIGASPQDVPPLSRYRAGHDLSPDEWHTVLAAVAALPPGFGTPPFKLDPVKDAQPALLERARQAYARSHKLPPDQAARVDPATALGAYYFAQYNAAYDDSMKLRQLPYPTLLPMLAAQAARVEQLVKDQPTNPFLPHLPHFDRAAETCARVDRQFAALTTVEALRTYAATHAGQLPQKLSDLTDTPAPPDPKTGHPFEYRPDPSTHSATLSAADPHYPLTYEVRLRS